MSEPTVSILVEIPESLQIELQSHLERNPDKDQDQIFASALSLYLLQNGGSKTAARIYLDSLFKQEI